MTYIYISPIPCPFTNCKCACMYKCTKSVQIKLLQCNSRVFGCILSFYTDSTGSIKGRRRARCIAPPPSLLQNINHMICSTLFEVNLCEYTSYNTKENIGNQCDFIEKFHLNEVATPYYLCKVFRIYIEVPSPFTYTMKMRTLFQFHLYW